MRYLRKKYFCRSYTKYFLALSLLSDYTTIFSNFIQDIEEKQSEQIFFLVLSLAKRRDNSGPRNNKTLKKWAITHPRMLKALRKVVATMFY